MKYRNQDILDQMTLEEKAALCSGRDFWHTKAFPQYGIPEMMMADGPHGLRKQTAESDMLGVNQSVEATCFPTAVTTGNSWDRELMGEIGAALAEEALANQVGVFLGPGVCLKRNPLCGRNFEYISEDPYLAGKLAASYIRRAQEKGAGTSLKHFACNSQEHKRFSSDSIVDERTLRELYLPAFETAVKEGKPATVMCAYNKLNGQHCSDHKELLTDILRTEWGFDGMVVTDWGALHDRTLAFQAGCDLMMPGGSAYGEAEALEAVRQGTLSEEDINACADRVLTMIRNAEQAAAGTHTYDRKAHHELARRAAEQGAVLLKNEGELLPLSADQKEHPVAFIGYLAENIRYQGSGSSHVNPTELHQIRELAPDIPYAPGYRKNGSRDDMLLLEAKKLAEQAETAVIFAGLPDSYESEGFDREHMRMPEGENDLIEAVAAVNPNTVVVLFCGSVVEVPWIDRVKSVLYLGLSGQAGAEAALNLLYGRAVPCGKLAETWPHRYEDCVNSSYYGAGYKDAQYREGLYMGYRYYDKADVPVRFPFGYGLSYTSFAYEDMKVEDRTVTAQITNTGRLAGSEIVQLYVMPPQDGLYRPQKELKGFCKVWLEPGETKKVCFELDDRSFAVWQDGWKVPEGTYGICLGASSKQILLQEEIRVEGSSLEVPEWQKGSWYEKPEGIPAKETWERMLGRKVSEAVLRRGGFDMDNTVAEMREHSVLMKIMYKAVEMVIAKGNGGKADYEDPAFKMMMASAADCSMSGMRINAGMKGYVFEGLLEMANGHKLKGLGTMLRRKPLNRK